MCVVIVGADISVAIFRPDVIIDFMAKPSPRQVTCT